jgi:hypothetical protein
LSGENNAFTLGVGQSWRRFGYDARRALRHASAEELSA